MVNRRAGDLTPVLDLAIHVEPAAFADEVEALQRLATASSAGAAAHAGTRHFTAVCFDAVCIIIVLVAGQGNGTLEGVVAFLAAAVRPRRAARFAAVGVVAIHLEVVRLAFVVLANPWALTELAPRVGYHGAGRFTPVAHVEVPVKEPAGAVKACANAVFAGSAHCIVDVRATDLTAVAGISISIVEVVQTGKAGTVGRAGARQTVGARQLGAANLAAVGDVAIQVEGVGLALWASRLAEGHVFSLKRWGLVAFGALLAAKLAPVTQHDTIGRALLAEASRGLVEVSHSVGLCAVLAVVRAAGQHGWLDEAVGTACTRSLLHIDGGVNDASATWELLHLVRGAALLRAASFMAFLGRHVPDAEATCVDLAAICKGTGTDGLLPGKRIRGGRGGGLQCRVRARAAQQLLARARDPNVWATAERLEVL
mmetsp:Transcript_119160/g.282751  ORF Transcript_119160/g.282751 Transcript_119160/m.282751 type:complete len:426 (+) Transcript_119160:979-2256(+)